MVSVKVARSLLCMFHRDRALQAFMRLHSVEDESSMQAVCPLAYEVQMAMAAAAPTTIILLTLMTSSLCSRIPGLYTSHYCRSRPISAYVW